MDFNIYNDLIDVIKNNMTDNVSKLIGASIFLLIGMIVCKFIRNTCIKALSKTNIDKGVSNFITYGVYTGCILIVLMSALETIGIPVGSFVAILGTLSIGLGLAFKETLANLGSGFILLFFKPFKVGDYISLGTTEGFVNDIHIFSTSLQTFDNKVIIIPNSKLTSDNIINYTKQDIRRVEVLFNLDYGVNMEKVNSLLNKIINSNNKIIKEKAPLIAVKRFKDYNLEMIVASWVKTDDYWEIYYYLTKEINDIFKKENIKMKVIQDLNLKK